MRITNHEIDENTQKEIEQMTLRIGGFNDKMVATDFSKDMYALFADSPSVVKGAWDIFASLRKLFVKWRIDSLSDSIEFHLDIKKFMKEFSQGEFYRQLKQLPPLEALATFLGLFKKPPSQCQGGQGGQGGQKEKNKSEKEGQQGETEEEQQGHSKDNLPIDLDKARGNLKKINKVARAGIYSDADLRDLAEQMLKQHGAGKEVRDLDIENTNLDAIIRIADFLGNRNMIIFDIARQKELLDSYKVGNTYHRSDFPDNELSVSKIESATEYNKLLPSEMALDDDIFFMRLAKNDLLIKEYQRKKRRKQALYMLIDVSGSMDGLRSVYASATALALVRQAVANEATYFLRFFDASPSQMYKVQNKEEALKISEILMRRPYSGGGTSITNAVATAVSDINNNKTKFDKVEIMLISDGDDPGFGLSKHNLKDIKLHSTIIDGNNSRLEGVSETYTMLSTRKLANRFLEAGDDDLCSR